MNDEQRSRTTHELASETVRLRKVAVNARLQLEAAMRLLPDEDSPLRKALIRAQKTLAAAAPERHDGMR